MEKYICVHGHFYQPPRENPWLEEVELQDSAHPYHDWNDRITTECYGPNAASRLLDRERRIIDIVNNYAKISFNFGPTLLSWLEDHRPDVYQALLDADKKSMENFSGHGSALAQCYNHMIMPLANRRDKVTQVVWGITDFEKRFGRRPAGIWLPETAVDVETLEILAEHEIAFTILAPRQCARVRKIGDSAWKDVHGERVDPRMPYVCNLPSGRKIALFFYDGHVSQDIAFRGLLRNGENMANRLMGIFSQNGDMPSQIVHVATDGETYGHHHFRGEMALAYAIHHIEANRLAKITIYPEYLEKHPPTHEAEIFDNSSWSCVHGVERWRANCGCCTGMNHSWHQEWRAPLRGALDWLRDNIAQIYEEQLEGIVDDPWALRNAYIEVILDRSRENIERFLAAHIPKKLTLEQIHRVLKCLEMQRHAMLMYTSCGWFFDEVSGIETVQILQYAARSLQLAGEISDVALEEAFIKLLERAPSNVAKYRTAAGLYRTHVQTAALDYLRVGAHYAISTIFFDTPQKTDLYTFTIQRLNEDRTVVGRQELRIGRILLASNITLEELRITYAVLHLGDHNLVAGVRKTRSERSSFLEMQEKVKGAFSRSDVAQCIRLIENHFSGRTFSLWHLFKDEQRHVLNQLLGETIQDVEGSLRQIFESYYPIMQGIRQMNVTLPPMLASTVELMLNTDMVRAVEQDPPDLVQVRELLAQARDWSSKIDRETLGFVVSQRIDALMQKFHEDPADIDSLEQTTSLLEMVQDWDLKQDFWKAQNLYFFIGKEDYPQYRQKASTGDEFAERWVEWFTKLGHILNVRVE